MTYLTRRLGLLDSILSNLRPIAVVLLCALCVGWANQAMAVLATEPLLTRAATVRPNLLLLLDTTASMNDTSAYATHYYNATTKGYGACSGTGTVPAIALLAPINNQLAYNPNTRYDPSYSSTGTINAQAAVGSTSIITYYLPKAGQTITNLTTKQSICEIARYDRYDVVHDTSASPKGFRYASGTNTAGPLQAANPITTKNPGRTDCAGTTCTYAEERKNIANYIAFHKTRFLALKSGVGKAFSAQPDTFRLAWSTMNLSTATPGTPPTDTSGATKGPASFMKNYGLAKTEFFTWLSALNDAGGLGTQLQTALDYAGQYYTRSDNNGPWGPCPWVATGSNCPADGALAAAPQGTPDQHLSCRKSYTIMVTDGEYDGTSARAAISGTDQDSVKDAQPEIVHNNGTTKYRYQPTWIANDLRNVGKSDVITNTTTNAYKDTLADIALYYWARDLRGADSLGVSGNVASALANDVTPGKPTDRPFWQNMTTYTAGLGVAGNRTAAQYQQSRAGTLNWMVADPGAGGVYSQAARIDDLVHAAWNGGGEYLTVNNAEQFATEIGRVVANIASDVFSQAGVAASAVTLTAGTKKFVPYYTSGAWWGNLKMVNLNGTTGDETGTAWQVISTSESTGAPTGTTTIPTPGSRNIATWSPSSGGISFNLTPLTTKGLRATSASTNASTLLVDTMDQATIDYLRGDRSNECDAGPECPTPMRKRAAILGDIVNSTPVFIKNNSDFGYQKLPSGTAGLSAYDAYKNTSADAKAKRTQGVLFIGANDGMVHGFRESDGQETFAYVPQSVFGNLHLLAATNYPTKHRYFVDGPMVESDAYISAPNKVSGTGTRWTNLVLGSTGAGARSVFALDATWPTSMGTRSILWEINQDSTGMEDIGNVMSEVQSGITASGDWVAIFGNGPNGKSGKAQLMVVNLATGELLKSIGTDSSTGNGLGGVRLVRNANSMIIGAYAGDLKGQVWRFDLSANSNKDWPTSGSLLFTAQDAASKAQPITAMPAVIARTDKDSNGKAFTGYMVVVGTGKLYDDADQANTDPQAAYGLWDQAPFGGTVTFAAVAAKTDLVPVSVTQDTSTKVSTASGLGTNPDGVTKYYLTGPVAKRIVDWTKDRGWYIDYTITPGQRSIFAIEPLQQVVRIDTIAPRTNQYSCAAGTSLGNNYLVSPLTGNCIATRTTLDTNGDGVIDNTNDSSSCIYSTEADGEDVVLDILSGGLSTGIVDIQDSRAHFMVRVGDPVPVPAATGAPGTSTRSWRQLYMR